MATTTTKRVTGAASGGVTTRLAPNLLLLEGDESGYLLLEGDMQSGEDRLKLEGDEAFAINSTVTKRVAEPVV